MTNTVTAGMMSHERMAECDLEDVVAAAVRLTAAHGARVAIYKTFDFMRMHSRATAGGKACRMFWRMVRESIVDANPEE